MPTWARALDDTALEVTTVDPAGRFVSQIEQQFIVVPDGTVAGAIRSGSTWTNPHSPPPPVEPDPVPPPTVYAVLEPATFLGLLLAVGLTKAQLGSARDDVNLRWLWVIFDALRHGVEHPDAGTLGSPLTADGFADLVTYGYLTTDRVAAAKAAWPTT